MLRTNQENPFRAQLYKFGINRAVDVPAHLSKSLGGKAHIPVEGWVEGVPIQSTLVPRGQGRHRLFVHSRIWKRLKIDKGDFVEVLLAKVEQPTDPAIPEELALALRMTKGAAAAFRQITPALRREFISWVQAAKQPGTRARRIQRGIPIIIKRARKRTQRITESAQRAATSHAKMR
jgi:Bacteriocin-protection, YdeI or OmpD-Associated/Domain of unknown function (DUF1905)